MATGLMLLALCEGCSKTYSDEGDLPAATPATCQPSSIRSIQPERLRNVMIDRCARMTTPEVSTPKTW
jgi:entry exclusion lipoprotein TrbK